MMADKPIIFSGPMVRALLDGRKTQTRRLLKAHTSERANMLGINSDGASFCDGDHPKGQHCEEHAYSVKLPYAPGDRLYVREAFSISNDGCAPSYLRFRADPEGTRGIPCSPVKAYGSRTVWRSPIHMPRWASRLTLTVTEVRVQRLQEISEADANAEGARPQATEVLRTYREAFSELWNSIHGPGAWDANPWVAAISFTVERRNIDAVAG